MRAGVMSVLSSARRTLGVACVYAIVLAALASPSHAQAPEALRKAQESFDEAQQHYLQARFDEAAQGFEKAYAARPFPQFLYNVGASYHMKAKLKSDVDAYRKAVEFYKRYLAEDPQAADKAKVEKAIGVLELEIQRLKTAGTPPAGTGSAAPPPAAPSQEVQQLGDVKVRGLIVIESEPSNATIYLDDKKSGPLGSTPWSGSLEGEHKIIIEKRGYKVAESRIQADPDKLLVLRTVIAEEDYLGWLEVSSNVPGAEIFIDDKTVGAVGKTPLSQNIKPGKHTIWITAEGYDEHQEQVEVIAGETLTVRAQLRGAPVGKLNVLGPAIEEATISVDGKVLCERGPCLKGVQQGDHVVTVSRPDHKPYSKRITVQAKTEMTIKVGLAPEPGRTDAIVAYVVAASFAGAGIWLGMKSSSYRDELDAEIAAGMPPPDPDDPRFFRGKAFAIGANAAYAVSGIVALTAIYYTFRDKGRPSTATMEVRALALTPLVGNGYAGLGWENRW